MLFTFPSRYLFTIDLKKYLVLGHSRPGFVRDFTSPAVLKICYRRVIIPFAYGAITRSGRAFQLASTRKLLLFYLYLTLLGSDNNYLATPNKHMDPAPSIYLSTEVNQYTQFIRFRLFPFRSPLLRELTHFIESTDSKIRASIKSALFISFPPATKMFQFTG